MSKPGTDSMNRTAVPNITIPAALIALLMAGPLSAAPVTRNEAYGAATNELPGFFAGPWHPAGELTLHNLSGDTVAYLFMFAGPRKQSNGEAQEETPAAFVTHERARLAGAGKSVSGDAPELYGEDRFASIVISANDSEPVVLRCFRGLPPQVVKEADALALAAKTRGAGAWRVRHCLMLGLFDEAYAIETPTGTPPALIVELRTRSVQTEEDAQVRAQSKRAAAPDPERIQQCQAGWARYRVADKFAATPPPNPVPGAGGRRKGSVVADESTNQPLLPGPQGR